ncbi:hypothetical protein CTRI78_v011291 [Colletotrichum trifolii]|uniref:Uncharacterized protein n=1 Tax=Colletotrichum trifolii TaxID=5466 RepID=A0A4V3HSP2_COLTR|nr:hypothetical protein CTRI78_v011291 [Colletotrichum trifolii]
MKLAVVLAAFASVVAAVAVPVAEPGTGFNCCCKDSSNKNVWIEGSGLRTCDQDCKGKGYVGAGFQADDHQRLTMTHRMNRTLGKSRSTGHA